MKLLLFLIPVALIGFFFSRSSSGKNQPVNDPYKGRTPFYCVPSFDPDKLDAANAPLFEGLGNLHYKITTKSEKAQRYFNQGLTLIYAFNHGEAGRSFKAAIKLDSACAMAYWGLAMVLGPNYNAALNPTKLTDINEAMDKAMQYAANATPKERALIHALSKRFPKEEEVKDIAPYAAAYAAAMKEVHEQYPDDVEIGVLYADALMNEHPWNLWLKNGTPQPWTPAIVAVLEKLLAKAPNHPNANHMYIHAMEASRQAAKALPSADRLRNLLPAAGHLVHMPSHIYIRTGHYHKGVLVNEKASAADSSYVTQCKVQGTYPLLYYPHNVHFLAACAFLEGNSRKAIATAWQVSRLADKKYIHENATVQHYFSIPYYVLVQTGRWSDVSQLKKPDEKLKYPIAVWHYARGMAYTAKNNLAEAQKELNALKEIGKDESLKSLLIWETNSAADLVQIAVNVLSGEMAAKQKQFAQAVELLKAAVAIEDGLMYQEPPDWYFSVRHTLGHVLLQAGQFAEAEKVYRQDLVMYPENGWALMGLYQSLKGQKKTAEAAAVKKRFDAAWQWADMKINSSRIY